MTQSRQYFNDDTIVAIATSAHVVAAIGIVRVSGSAVRSIVEKILKSPDAFLHIESHKMYRALLRDAEGADLDDALFVFMKGPHSYTGEDSLELHLHGNPRLLQRAVAAVVATGFARVAYPGEFSFRAFRNGKIDLSQAESTFDLIASVSSKKTEHALRGVLGDTRNFVESKKQELLRFLAEIEVDIDFSDQGLSVLDYQSWAEKLEGWCLAIEKARERFHRQAPLRDGIRLAIVGAPNSGKSTLFNRLLGEDRSIVSNVAGTTRDVVRESFTMGGLLFLLSDTAGIRDTGDAIESQGILRSLGELQGADLVLWIVDASDAAQIAQPLKELRHFRAENTQAKILIIFNKIDLVDGPKVLPHDKEFAAPLYVSAKQGIGLKEVEQSIIKLFAIASGEEESCFSIGRIRHSELLGRAVTHARAALKKFEAGEAFPDLLASDLRASLACLGEITGEVGIEDVLGLIFSEFCIGK